jgi:hypothetical protein
MKSVHIIMAHILKIFFTNLYGLHPVVYLINMQMGPPTQRKCPQIDIVVSLLFIM